MSKPEPGAVYPRDVPVLEGMPSGWKGVEKEYGPTSRTAGAVYCRYFSLDGRHRNICTAKQVILLDCEDKGLDGEKMLADFRQIQLEHKAKDAADRKVQREAHGKLSGVQRETKVERFRDKFGQLSGPVVFGFKGWVTRWHYQPNCDQVMVEYVDTEGASWKLLKDLECAFQNKIDKGEGAYIPALIEKAKRTADPIQFSEGAKMARQTGGLYEMSAETGESRVMSQDDRQKLVKQTLENRKTSEAPVLKKARHGMVSLSPELPVLAVVSPLQRREDVLQAFPRFRNFLKQRGFQSCELVAVFGSAPGRVYTRRISGFYYRMGEKFEEDRCYQKLLHFPKARDEVGCDSLYIVRSATLQRWEITTHLREFRPILAHSGEALAGTPLLKAKGPWQLQDGNADFHEDAGLAVILDPGMTSGG